MRIVWNEVELLVPGLIVLAAMAIGLFFSYRRRATMPPRIRWLAAGLKWTGFAFLLFFLLRPEVVTSFNRPGTNHWAILLDDSASMTLKDQADGLSRGDRLNEIIKSSAGGWQEKLAADFVVDRFSYDLRPHRHNADEPLAFAGQGSALARSLGDLRDRYAGQPFAGVLVITDGSPTDSAALDERAKGLPPVFPLVIVPDKKPG